MSFQAMLGRPQTGWLTPLEKVRAIQYAAVNGSSKAQLVLAVMYAEGVGVVSDYSRSFHWFEAADKQGSGEAKFAMSQFFSLGVQGVADQDKAKAVVYQVDAALSGFHPSTDRLQQILQRMNRRRFGGGFAYGRGGPCCQGGPGGPPGYGNAPPPGYGQGSPLGGVGDVIISGPGQSGPGPGSGYGGPGYGGGPGQGPGYSSSPAYGYGQPPAYGRR